MPQRPLPAGTLCPNLFSGASCTLTITISFATLDLSAGPKPKPEPGPKSAPKPGAQSALKPGPNLRVQECRMYWSRTHTRSTRKLSLTQLPLTSRQLWAMV